MLVLRGEFGLAKKPRSTSYGLDAIPEEWISKLVNKMMVFNAASDLYKKCNKDNIIDNLDFSSCK